MAAAPYKLSCVLYGHSLDVRAVAVTDDYCIISGSRDKTAKIWRPKGFEPGYQEVQTLKGHTNFVSCVCYVPPHANFPTGLVVTGSNDNTICAFTIDSSDPVYKLIGHINAVCCLAVGENNILLSGSWDCTARVWNGEACIHTLSGHEAAVWSVLALKEDNLMVTGSADKTIKLWKEGNCVNTLTGHTDCVRGLAVVSAAEFLSCGNDASVRQWTAGGDCTGVYYGHSNYIYSIAVFPGAGFEHFVTSGEDRTMRIWKGGHCTQTIFLPAQSIWSVACLRNGDVVVGSSDGVVRVFSADPSRQVSQDAQKAFEDEVAGMTVAAQQELGGVKISDLPGKEVLYEPGRQDGQTKLVREGENVFCYSWNAGQSEWVKVGDVIGAAGGTQGTSGKTLYEGKEYDYVFSVDIKDGEPPLKLPYNITEDPWFAAQKFIHTNNLSQGFLEQIANFIIENAKGVTLGEAPSLDFVDPFTGENRYIPGQDPRQGNPTRGADPFTGGSRYVPGASAPAVSNHVTTAASSSEQTTAKAQCPVNAYFPQKTYIKFEQANLQAIQEKLLELNGKTGDGIHTVQDEAIQEVVKLANTDRTVNPACLQVLKQLLEWPQDIVFPALDITRLAIRNRDVNMELCSGRMGAQFVAYLRKFLRADALPANQMLTLRIVCNMFSHGTGEELVLHHWQYFLSVLVDLLPPANRHVQVAMVTVLLNLSVAFVRTNDVEGQTRAVSVATAIMPQITDGEAQFRLLVALGTLLWQADRKIVEQARDSELNDLVTALSLKNDQPKVASCAAQVKGLIV